MLTKGDVLVALGKIKNAWGSAEKLSTDRLGPSGRRASEVSVTVLRAARSRMRQGLTGSVDIDYTVQQDREEGGTAGCPWVETLDLERYDSRYIAC